MHKNDLRYVVVDGGDCINTHIKQIRYKCAGWACLAVDRDEKRDFANMIIMTMIMIIMIMIIKFP